MPDATPSEAVPIEGRIYFDPPIKAAAFAAKKGEKAKGALGKLAQLIPGEVLGAYGAALGTLHFFEPAQQPWIGLTCFILGIICTAWYVGWQIGPGFKKQRHLLVYMAAFAIWAYSLTGKTALPWIYNPGVGALLPIAAVVVVNKIKLPKRAIK